VTDPKAKVLIVFDSLGGTPSSAEAGADADEKIQLATAAKVIKRNLRVMVPRWISRHDIIMMVINTNYANIGSVVRSNSGGDGLEFASAFIIQLSRVKNLTQKKGDQTLLLGIVTRASKTKDHLQTSETSLKDVMFEIYAYEIKPLTKFHIKKDAIFINDTGRLTIVKASKKTDTVELFENFDNDPNHKIPSILTYEELTQYLKVNDFDTLVDSDDE